MQRSDALLTAEAKCLDVHKKSRFTSRAKWKKALEAQAKRAIQLMTHDWLVNRHTYALSWLSHSISCYLSGVFY